MSCDPTRARRPGGQEDKGAKSPTEDEEEEATTDEDEEDDDFYAVSSLCPTRFLSAMVAGGGRGGHWRWRSIREAAGGSVGRSLQYGGPRLDGGGHRDGHHPHQVVVVEVQVEVVVQVVGEEVLSAPAPAHAHTSHHRLLLSVTQGRRHAARVRPDLLIYGFVFIHFIYLFFKIFARIKIVISVAKPVGRVFQLTSAPGHGIRQIAAARLTNWTLARRT